MHGLQKSAEMSVLFDKQEDLAAFNGARLRGLTTYDNIPIRTSSCGRQRPSPAPWSVLLQLINSS